MRKATAERALKQTVSEDTFREHLSGSGLFTGKLPPKVYPKDTVRLRDYLAGPKKALPTPPSTLPAIGRGIDFGMFLNDNLGDCTHASLQGHLEQIHSTRAGKAERPTDDMILRDYRATGVLQGLGDQDGRYMAGGNGVLDYAKKTGFEQADGTREKILGYVSVNWLDDIELRTAIWLFGGVYVGIALPISAYYQIQAGKPWGCSSTNNTPGGWGGHAIIATTRVSLITWSKRQSFTDCFRKHYWDECYAVLTHDWTQNTLSPSGFPMTELVRDLEEIGR